jgi:DnaJ domain
MGPTQQSKMSFHEILLEKMSPAENEKPSSTDSVMNDDLGHFSLGAAADLAAVALHELNIPPLKAKKIGSYHIGKTQKSPLKAAPVKPEISWPVNQLSTSAQLCIDVLQLNHIASCKNPALRLSDVKSAYRKLARKLHPDLNPNANSEDFRRVKEAAQILIDELTALNKKANPAAAAA